MTADPKAPTPTRNIRSVQGDKNSTLIRYFLAGDETEHTTTIYDLISAQTQLAQKEIEIRKLLHAHATVEAGLKERLAEVERKNVLALGPDCHGYLRADTPGDIGTIKYIPACVEYKANAEAAERRASELEADVARRSKQYNEQAERVAELEAALRELARLKTPYGDCWCDGRYGHSPGCLAARRLLEQSAEENGRS